MQIGIKMLIDLHDEIDEIEFVDEKVERVELEILTNIHHEINILFDEMVEKVEIDVIDEIDEIDEIYIILCVVIDLHVEQELHEMVEKVEVE